MSRIIVWIYALLLLVGIMAGSGLAQDTPVTQPQATSTPSVSPDQNVTGTGTTAQTTSSSDAKAFSFLNEMQKESLKFLFSLVLLLITWGFSMHVLANWEVRKKRAELDLTLPREFHTLVGTYRAIWREWKVSQKSLRTRLPSGGSDALPSGGSDALPSDGSDALLLDRADLFRRAAAAEGEVEAMLLKMITEYNPESEDIATLALFRQGYQRLREQIQKNNLAVFGFKDTEYWLFHVLVSNVSNLIVAHTYKPISRVRRKGTQAITEDYLAVLAYRSANWDKAVRTLEPHVKSFIDAREKRKDHPAVAGEPYADEMEYLAAISKIPLNVGQPAKKVK